MNPTLRPRRRASLAFATLLIGLTLAPVAHGSPITGLTAVAAVTPVGPWSALGSNGAGIGALNGAVTAVTVAGSDVYVGGAFTNAGGIPAADYVAKWNGSAWSALGSDGFGGGALSAGVNSIAVSGSEVYVAGSFQNAAGMAAGDYVAQWNAITGNWSSLGSALGGGGAITGVAYAVTTSGSDVYVGGQFANVAGVLTADNIAKWDGLVWSALGVTGANGALNGRVNTLQVLGGSVYAGGVFENAAGIATADRVARWNGIAWSALGSDGAGNGALSAGHVLDLAVGGTDLYVAGQFSNAAGINTADYIARWNGTTWAPLGSNGAGNGALSGPAQGVVVVGSHVFVGGAFNITGLPAASRMAVWNGSAWSALGSDGNGGSPINNLNCCAMAASASAVYVGGAFTDAGAISTADYIAKWSLIPFTDIADSQFRSDIEWVFIQGITTGCTTTTYCPNGSVTRGQMASFLARALHLSGAAPDAFTDDETSEHEVNINLVAREGIASGCGGTKFCPLGIVSREQMASFLARALDLSGAAADAFTDDETSIHEVNINLVAREGIATGCGATNYCPTANVTRGQMAAFLHRAFGP